MLDRQAVLSRPPELPRLSEPFYKFARRHVAVRLSQGNVARRSLAPWMLVLLSNPGALWQPAAATCGVSIRTVVLICSCSAVSSRRAPRVCLASALRAYVRVAPARSARTIISVPMLIATKSSFLQLGHPRGSWLVERGMRMGVFGRGHRARVCLVRRQVKSLHESSPGRYPELHILHLVRASPA